jgi:hypothetical protein
MLRAALRYLGRRQKASRHRRGLRSNARLYGLGMYGRGGFVYRGSFRMSLMSITPTSLGPDHEVEDPREDLEA